MWLCVSRNYLVRRQVGDPLFTCGGWGGGPHFHSLKKGLRMSTSPFWKDLRITSGGLVRLRVPRTGGAPGSLCGGVGWWGARCRCVPLGLFVSAGSAGPRAASAHAPSRPLSQAPARDRSGWG